MKKSLCIILTAVILISSVFSLSAFAAASPKTDALLDKVENADELSVTFTSGQSTIFSFLGRNPVNKVSVKDNKISYEFNNGIITVRLVANDDGIYAYLPILPFFYVKLDSKILAVADVKELIAKASNLTQGFIQFIDSYNETFDGKEYYVEEYNDREVVTSKFYYDGDSLKILKVENAVTKSVQYTYFDAIAFEADDGLFDVPVLAFDVTPLLQGLFLALIGTALPV
ncbi:MAG: hypothetical protein E7516_03605 [Ruminococcaceae bacterium]|nr:hypothetical protein [Oscillospiraceae bacterium]